MRREVALYALKCPQAAVLVVSMVNAGTEIFRGRQMNYSPVRQRRCESEVTSKCVQLKAAYAPLKEAWSSDSPGS
jgi:hypothetical protein